VRAATACVLASIAFVVASDAACREARVLVSASRVSLRSPVSPMGMGREDAVLGDGGGLGFGDGGAVAAWCRSVALAAEEEDRWERDTRLSRAW